MVNLTRQLLGFPKSSEYPVGTLGLNRAIFVFVLNERFLNFVQPDSCLSMFPFCPRRNWFKGADTVSILAFLEHCLPEKLAGLDDDDDDEARDLFRSCLIATQAANKFMKTLYSAAFWLTLAERDALITAGHACVDAFLQCANHCYHEGLTRFKIQPKLHMFGELVVELEYQRQHSLPSPNMLIYSTQQDEDFVGKICFYSRHVSIRTIHMRTLSRYQIALATLV